MDAALKARLGRKWTCFSCAKKFYDLQKPKPICPSCNVDQETRPPEAPTKLAKRPGRARKSTKAKAPKAKAPTAKAPTAKAPPAKTPTAKTPTAKTAKAPTT